MSKINWTQVVVFGVIVLLVFLIGASLLGGYAGWGMMGGWGFGPFGWLVMILMWLFPLGLLALLVLGIVWLFQQVSSPTRPAAGSPQALVGRLCPNCGRPAQVDWRVCPYCGQALT